MVGGITAALIDFSGIPEDDACRYESAVQAGSTLVAVKVSEEDTIEARRILVADGASSVRDNQTGATEGGGPVRVSVYDAAGQPVNRELEYGAPTNPTTVDRSARSALPAVDPLPNSARPAAEDMRGAGKPIGAPAGASRPAAHGRQSSLAEPQPPETLGSPRHPPEAGADALDRPPAPSADQQGGAARARARHQPAPRG